MQRVKLVAALVLASCLALPISTCSVYLDENGEPIPMESGRSPPPGAEEYVTTSYPVTSWSEAPNALVWLWPLLAVVCTHLTPWRHLRTIVWWLEPPLVVFSVSVVSLFGAFQRPAIGLHLALGSLAAYLLAWLAQAATRLRARLRAS